MEKKSRKPQESGSGARALGPLDFARNLEVKGATLYLKFAVDAENLLSKQLFYSLAVEEIEHAKKIDEIYTALRNNQGWQPAAATLPSVESKLKKFFAQAGKTDFKKDASSAVSYELALEMERSSFRAYTDFYNQTQDATEKEFFKRLLSEEQEHIDALTNVYYYLTDTADWLQEDESHIWNWMNL